MATKDILHLGRLFRTTVVQADGGSGEPVLELNYVQTDATGTPISSANPLSTSSKLVGDDGAVIAGAKSDTAWDGAAASPTWTALYKYMATKLEAIRVLAASTSPVQFFRSDSFTNITTKTTTTVKSGAGSLSRIIINKTGSADTLAIYDNTAGSGTLIGTINTPTVGMNFNFDCAFATGLTIVSGGTTAGDYTVIWR